MAAPTLVHNYPADGDTGIPVGEAIILYFDTGVDEEVLKESVVLYGADFDRTSGPDQALWIDGHSRANPFYLQSPGFKGVVPLEFEFAYWDTTDTVTYVEVTPGTLTSQADETAGNYGSKVTIRPKEGTLKEELSYNLYITGDPDATGTVGVSARTRFDTVPDGGNAATTGSLILRGSWDGVGTDTLNIEVLDSGDIGTAKYKWWYTSLGTGSAVSGRVTSRRYRKLSDGLQIRFTGSGFVAGDTYTVGLEETERLTTNYKVTFETNDGSWTAAPAATSTPASSTPPSSVLPTGSSSSTTGSLSVSEMLPVDGAYNIAINNREIVITFSEDVDASTITQDTVTLTKYPVSGHYGQTWAPDELEKELVVSGNTLTIKF